MPQIAWDWTATMAGTCFGAKNRSRGSSITCEADMTNALIWHDLRDCLPNMVAEQIEERAPQLD